MQAVASLAVLAKVHAEAKSDADAGLLNIIQEHEAAFLAWDATGIEDGLSEGSPEDRAAYAAETLLIFAPCRSYADVRAKIGYIYHRQTAAAQDAYDAVVGREDDFLGFLGSLIGIEAPEMRAAADEAGNDTLIDVIQAYRVGVKAYADHPEFSSHDEENEVAEATYGVHADKLDKWDTPATSREEAMEALRFALEDAAQWCGSVTTSTMIKAALGYLEGSACVSAGCASTSQTVATALPTIPEMYEEWLAVRNAPSDRTDEEMDEGLSRYQILQARIIAAEPQTPRDVAIMFIVDSDYMESDHSEEFESRVREMAVGSTSEDAAPPAETIETLFHEWMAVSQSMGGGDTPDIQAQKLEQYGELRERITGMRPVTVRELAILLYVETTAGCSDYSDDFMTRVFALAGLENDNVPEDAAPYSSAEVLGTSPHPDTELIAWGEEMERLVEVFNQAYDAAVAVEEESQARGIARGSDAYWAFISPSHQSGRGKRCC